MPGDQFAGLLDFVVAERARWGDLFLPRAGLGPAGAAIAGGGGFSLLKPHSPPLRAIGQIVSRKAAERLLAISTPFDRPVDTFLQMAWVTGVTMLAATPPPLRDV